MIKYVTIASILISFIYCKGQDTTWKIQNENLNNWISTSNTLTQAVISYQNCLQKYFTTFDTLQICKNPITQFSADSDQPTVTKDSLYQFLHPLYKKAFSNAALLQFSRDKIYSQQTVDSLNSNLKKYQESSQDLNNQLQKYQSSLIRNYQDIQKNAQEEYIEEVVYTLLDSIEKGYTVSSVRSDWISDEILLEITVEVIEKIDLFFTLVEHCNQNILPEDLFRRYFITYYISVQDLQNSLKDQWKYFVLKEFYEQEVRESKIFPKRSSSNDSLEIEKLIHFYPVQYEFDFNRMSDFGYTPDIFLTLILDVSNSMNKSDKLPKLKLAVNQLINQLRPKDDLLIILFSNASHELIMPRLKDKDIMKEKVNNIIAFGDTFPESAIFRAYNIMNQNPISETNNRVILITDGSFDVTNKMRYFVKEGNKKDISFSLMLLAGETFSDKDFKKLNQLPELGNGNFYFIRESEDIYKVVINEIKSTRKENTTTP